MDHFMFAKISLKCIVFSLYFPSRKEMSQHSLFFSTLLADILVVKFFFFFLCLGRKISWVKRFFIGWMRKSHKCEQKGLLNWKILKDVVYVKRKKKTKIYLMMHFPYDVHLFLANWKITWKKRKFQVGITNKMEQLSINELKIR